MCQVPQYEKTIAIVAFKMGGFLALHITSVKWFHPLGQDTNTRVINQRGSTTNTILSRSDCDTTGARGGGLIQCELCCSSILAVVYSL